MLSVQSPGCAGMERLGVPVRSSLGSPPDDRSHISRRMRVDAAIQARDILVRDTTILSDRKVRDNYHSYHIHSAGNTHHGRGGCPPHIPLPDGEYGQDRDLQIRTACQQTEITRSYIKPPPNKTVLDVPEQSYNLFPSSSSLSPSICLTTCNLGNFSQQQANNNINHRVSPQDGCPVQQKSKPNVLKKFLRQISPKMPSSTTASSTSTSSSSNSTLSSASSSYSSSSPPLSLSLSATALTTTNCNLGTNLVTLGTSTSSSVSGSGPGPVSVSVPASVTIPVTMPAASLSTIPQTSMSISNIQCLQHSESSSSVTIAPPTTTYSTTINSDAVSFINNNHQLSHRDNI